MNTTVITVVLLEICISLRTAERNEVIHVHLKGVSVVTEKDYRETATSLLTDPWVGFMLLHVEHAS